MPYGQRYRRQFRRYRPFYGRRVSGRSRGRVYRRGFRRSTFARRTRRSARGIYGNRATQWWNKRYVVRSHFFYGSFSYTAGTTPAPGAGYTLMANDIPSFSTLASRFDQYKLYKWKIEFQPSRLQPATIADAYTSTQPAFGFSRALAYLKNDETDAATPTDIVIMRDSPGVVISTPFKALKRIIRPKFRALSDDSPTIQGHTPRTGWLACTNPYVPHFGFKFMVDTPKWTTTASPAPSFFYDIYYTVYWAFKNVAPAT